jgi:hypothetical protein
MYSFPDYAQSVEEVLNAVTASGEASLVNIQIDQGSSLRGFIAGYLQFTNSAPPYYSAARPTVKSSK